MSLRNFFETAYSIFWITGVLLIFYFFLVPLAPVFSIISPLATVLFVLVGTAFSVSTSRLTSILSVMGLIIYGVSWLITKECGTIPSMLMCTTGILVWFFAFFKSIQRSFGL